MHQVRNALAMIYILTDLRIVIVSICVSFCTKTSKIISVFQKIRELIIVSLLKEYISYDFTGSTNAVLRLYASSGDDSSIKMN